MREIARKKTCVVFLLCANSRSFRAQIENPKQHQILPKKNLFVEKLLSAETNSVFLEEKKKRLVQKTDRNGKER
jgi:hypothetical protein